MGYLIYKTIAKGIVRGHPFFSCSVPFFFSFIKMHTISNQIKCYICLSFLPPKAIAAYTRLHARVLVLNVSLGQIGSPNSHRVFDKSPYEHPYFANLNIFSV